MTAFLDIDQSAVPLSCGSDTLTSLPTVEMFGLSFLCCEDEITLVEHLLDWKPTSSEPMLLVTPNVDILVRLQRVDGPEIRAIVESADLLLPDGYPILQVARWAEIDLPSRLAGSSVFAEMWPRLAAMDRPVTVLGSNRQVSEMLASEHSSAETIVAPILGDDPALFESTARAVADRAIANNSEFIVIGIAFPKDLRIAEIVRDEWPSNLPAPMILCFGAGPEMYLGLQRRAPQWMQHRGLEWLYRFMKEPRRLFRRYFIQDVAFFPMAAKEIKKNRSRGQAHSNPEDPT